MLLAAGGCEAFQHCGSGPCTLWSQRLPAVADPAAHGSRPGLRSRSGGHAHCAGGRWAGNEQVRELCLNLHLLPPLQQPSFTSGLSLTMKPCGCSRNRLLAEADRQRALCIYQALSWAQHAASVGDVQSATNICKEVERRLAMGGAEVDYVEVCFQQKALIGFAHSPCKRECVLITVAGCKLVRDADRCAVGSCADRRRRGIAHRD